MSAATTTTTASVPVSMPLPVPSTGCSGTDPPHVLHHNAMGDHERYGSNHLSPSSASASGSGSGSGFASISSSCPSATGLDAAGSIVIGNGNRSRPPHASASGQGGVAYHQHPWGSTAAAATATTAAANNSARHLLQSISPLSSSSSPPPTAASHETLSPVKVKTDTPGGTRKSRTRKRHRHRKTGSRSDNDLDSLSTVNLGHEKDNVTIVTGDVDRGHSAQTIDNLENPEFREKRSQSTVPLYKQSEPIEANTQDASRDDDGHNKNDPAQVSRPRASTNATGPMIVDSNVARRSAASSQQETTSRSQLINVPISSQAVQRPAPYSNIGLNAPHSSHPNTHNHFHRRGRGSISGSGLGPTVAAASPSGSNTVAARLGPARRCIPTAPTSTIPPCRQLSTTATIGSLDIVVFLPGMKQPVTFHNIPQRRYTKLPDHRPPLRRDKPVRIMLPGAVGDQGSGDGAGGGGGYYRGYGPYTGDRLIYPAPDRSFIFIPRELRPNQRTSTTFIPRGGGRGRGRGGGHVPGKSLDSSAYNAELVRTVYQYRRQQLQQEPYAAAGHSHSHSLSLSNPYFNRLSTRSRRSSSFGLPPPPPAAGLPPRPMPVGLAPISMPPKAVGPGPGSMARFPPHVGNALQPPPEAQYTLPGPGMMMSSPVFPHAVTTAHGQAMVPAAYNAAPPSIDPTAIPAPPFPPPTHRHNPLNSSSLQAPVPASGNRTLPAPAATSVPIHQPQPQKRISVPNIINHVQGDTPPPLQQHRQDQAEAMADAFQDQKYQVLSPALSAAQQPLQPYDPVVAYPSSTAGERQNTCALSQDPNNGHDRGTNGTDYYPSPYQLPLPPGAPGSMVPHPVASEYKGTVFYQYEYPCDTSTSGIPYQQEQSQIVGMQQPPLPEPPIPNFQQAISPTTSGLCYPGNPQFIQPNYNMPPLPSGAPTTGGPHHFGYPAPAIHGQYGPQFMYGPPLHMQPLQMPLPMAMHNSMPGAGMMHPQSGHMHMMASRNGR